MQRRAGFYATMFAAALAWTAVAAAAEGFNRRAAPGEELRAPLHELAAPGEYDPRGGFLVSAIVTERQHEAVFVGVPSATFDRGASLYVYSVAAEKLFPLLENVNAVTLLAAQSSARTCQRSFCSGATRDGGVVYFGTASVPEPEGYEGGHVLAFDLQAKTWRDLGIVAPGFSVKRLAVSEGGVLAVVGRAGADGAEETRLYCVNPQDGRSEALRAVNPADAWTIRAYAYISGPNSLRRWQSGARFGSVSMLASDANQARAEGSALWIGASRDGRRGMGYFPANGCLLWQDASRGARNQLPPFRVIRIDPLTEILKRTPAARLAFGAVASRSESELVGGLAYAVEMAEKGVTLKVCSTNERRLREYGPLLDLTGKPVGEPLALGADGNRNLFLACRRDDGLKLAVIEDLLVNEIMEAETRYISAKTAKAKARLLPIRSISLTAISAHLDRPFDPPLAASDGNIYFGTMPHDPFRGAWMMRYDPRTDKLESLGEIDAAARQNGPGDVPSMIHCGPAELDGKIFFVGQDPFYGREYGFPEWPPGKKHAGSHVVSYEMKTGKLRDHGIPAPEVSIFGMAADARNNRLYLRENYEGGPIDYMDLATDRVTRTEIQCPHGSFLVGPDGRLYMSREKEDKGGGGTGRYELVSYDPASDKGSVVKTDVSGRVKWLGMDGDNAVALIEPAVYIFDFKTRRLEKAGSFSTGGLLGGYSLAGGYVYRTEWRSYDPTAGRQVNGPRVTHLMTMRLSDGLVSDYGALIDQKERIVDQAFGLVATGDGSVYLHGTITPRAGDPYSPRLKATWLCDSCFMILKDFKPQEALGNKK